MLGVCGLFETHITVSDLDRSLSFYQNVTGLLFALAFPEREAAFLWIGEPGRAMVGLWKASGPIGLRLHFALTVSLEDLLAAPARLKRAGVAAFDFYCHPCDEPSVFGWMPAASVYFDDPDGHSLELLTMLPGNARPELGVASWRTWVEALRADA